jgi:predicted nucleic acid-binding protein
MILVDTSAWIVSFKKARNHDLKEFVKQAIVSGHAVTSPIIILELLQGCRSIEERDSLRIKLESLDLLPITPAVWEQTYELGFSLRRRGLTIPTVDLIIAALALEHRTFLLHQTSILK